MAIRILRNTRQNAVILATATEANVAIAGNNSVSAIGLSTVTDTISGAHIKQIWAGSISGGSGYWTVSRGANTVAMMDSTVWWDLAGNGCAINLDEAATLSLTRTGAAGTIMLELQKVYTNGMETRTSNY